MKKLTIVVIFISLLSAAHAQKINESEARQYLEKVWGYLKTSDSVAFVNLWLSEDSAWQKLHTPPDGPKLMQSYRRLKKFLNTVENMDIDHVAVGQEDTRGTAISAFIKAREHATIGFTFYVAPINGQWTARGRPGYFAM